MNFNTLNDFRQGAYQCFTRAADALFNTVDALLTQTTARSFIELSLSPFFQRRWASLYEGFEDGCIERRALQELFVAYAPGAGDRCRPRWGLDATSIARPQARTSADRTAVLVHNLPHNQRVPVTAGWHFSTLVVLPEEPSSWCYILENRRIASTQTPAEVGAAQLSEVVALLPEGVRPIVTADRAYPSAPFLQATAGLACDKLLRCASNRVFYRPAPAPTGKRGAPRKDGERFACSDPSTHGPSDAHWEGEDESGHRLEVDRWDHLHMRKAREIELSVIRVSRAAASGKQRDPRVSWFIWVGQEPIAPWDVPADYKRRYSIEHSYRFDKQALLWEEPRLRTPEQFERWSQVVAIVHNLLVLARPLVQAQRLPWERTCRPVTPQQVRRSLAPIVATLGTPARPPQPRGKSPGRAREAVIRPAPRYPVVYKAKPKPKKQPTVA